MIDPKSLMIGNYVLLQDKGIYQIDSGHDLDELDSFPINDDYCKPIPLNEDWLVNLGAIKKTYKLPMIDLGLFGKKIIIIGMQLIRKV